MDVQQLWFRTKEGFLTALIEGIKQGDLVAFFYRSVNMKEEALHLVGDVCLMPPGQQELRCNRRVWGHRLVVHNKGSEYSFLGLRKPEEPEIILNGTCLYVWGEEGDVRILVESVIRKTMTDNPQAEKLPPGVVRATLTMAMILLTTGDFWQQVVHWAHPYESFPSEE